MQAYIWIGLGGALGSMARHWSTGLVNVIAGTGFPWGTLVVNVAGCLIIGFGTATLSNNGLFPSSQAFRQFLMVGICGGYTTFSAFSLETLYLLERGQWLSAIGNAGMSVSLCVGTVWIGYMVGVFISPR